MSLLPYKALTTQINFQKPLRLHFGENEAKYICLHQHFPASSLVHTKKPENDKTNETSFSYEAMFLSI